MNDRLTQSDIDKMQKEIEYRKLELRKQLLEDVKEARSHGDLSENFEYYAAKKAKNQNESRIRYLPIQAILCDYDCYCKMQKLFYPLGQVEIAHIQFLINH